MYRCEYCAGVDEVGRGPLAGPVYAAAVVLDPFIEIDGLRDSKALSVKKRESLNAFISSEAIDFSIGADQVFCRQAKNICVILTTIFDLR